MDNEGITLAENNQIIFSKKNIFIFCALLIIIFCIILVIAKIFHATPKTAYRTYTDKSKYFSIQIPKNWTASEDVAQGTTGVGTPQETTQNVEETQLVVTPDAGIDIQVYEGAPTCPIDPPTDSSFADFPASYDSTTNTWTIPTDKALITITTSYPGSNALQHTMQQSVPTPVPSAIAQQNKNAMMEIIKTLTFTGLTPFKC